MSRSYLLALIFVTDLYCSGRSYAQIVAPKTLDEKGNVNISPPNQDRAGKNISPTVNEADPSNKFIPKETTGRKFKLQKNPEDTADLNKIVKDIDESFSCGTGNFIGKKTVNNHRYIATPAMRYQGDLEKFKLMYVYMFAAYSNDGNHSQNMDYVDRITASIADIDPSTFSVGTTLVLRCRGEAACFSDMREPLNSRPSSEEPVVISRRDIGLSLGVSDATMEKNIIVANPFVMRARQPLRYPMLKIELCSSSAATAAEGGLKALLVKKVPR